MCACAWVCTSRAVTNPGPLRRHLPQCDKAEAKQGRSFHKEQETERITGCRALCFLPNFPFGTLTKHVGSVSRLQRVCGFYSNVQLQMIDGQNETREDTQ